MAMRCAPPVYLSSVVTQKQSLFTVQGQGSVSSTADIAMIDIGATSSGQNLKEVQNQTDTIVQKLIQVMQEIGIDENEITTDQYSVSPQYDYKTTPRKIMGYQVSNNLSIKILDLKKINSVITHATGAGANKVGNIRFVIDEAKGKRILTQARAIAIKEAKDKASSLAKLAGMKLGRILNVQENQSNPYLGRAFSKSMASDESSPSIQAGSKNVTSRITLTYEVR